MKSGADDAVSPGRCSGIGRRGPGRLRLRQACSYVAAAASFGRDSASGQRADHDRASGTDVCVSRGAGARPCRRHRAEARVQGRQRRQGGTAALPDRPRALHRRAEQRDRHRCRRREANLASTTAQAERYKVLVAANAVSKQDYDNAVAAQGQAAADVATGKAAVAIGADQPRLHQRGIADHRPQRCVAGHAGCVRAGERRDAHGDRAADRSRSTWT